MVNTQTPLVPTTPREIARHHARQIVISALWDREGENENTPTIKLVRQKFVQLRNSAVKHIVPEHFDLIEKELRILGFGWPTPEASNPATAPDCNQLQSASATVAAEAQTDRKPDPRPMTLVLTNGYPSPWLPQYAGTPEQQAEGADNPYSIEATTVSLTLEGVVHFEHKHDLTVEFATMDDCLKAKRLTGWDTYGGDPLILEAKTNSDECYGHPSIVASVPYELESGYGEGVAPCTAYHGYLLIAN